MLMDGVFPSKLKGVFSSLGVNTLKYMDTHLKY